MSTGIDAAVVTKPLIMLAQKWQRMSSPKYPENAKARFTTVDPQPVCVCMCVRLFLSDKFCGKVGHCCEVGHLGCVQIAGKSSPNQIPSQKKTNFISIFKVKSLTVGVT